MASAPGSSSRLHGPQEGELPNMASAPGSSSHPQEGHWQICSVPHLQLSRLQTPGYLPLADLVNVRVGLASIGNDVMVENFPNPNKEERVCFVPFLLRA